MSVTITRNEASKGRIYNFDDLEDGDAYEWGDEIYIINKYGAAEIVGFGIDGNGILWTADLDYAKLVHVYLQITVS